MFRSAFCLVSVVAEGLDLQSKVDPEAAEALLSQMEDQGVIPNAVTYTTVASAYARTHRPAEAERILNKMLKEGITPDAVAFTTILKVGGLMESGMSFSCFESGLCRRESSSAQGCRYVSDTVLSCC